MKNDRKIVEIAGRPIGDEYPVYIIAEIGIDHNGSVELAKKLIDIAVVAGVDAVKFQKRTPELAVPRDQWDIPRETPWGVMKYIDYKKKIEFGYEEYAEIDKYVKDKNIIWFASVWDEPSVDFLKKFNVPAYKIPSAALTDHGLLKKVRETGKPIILSTGMSTLDQIKKAVKVLGGTDDLIILHSTSTYPAKPEELNLKVITKLREIFDCPIGYSGHETGLPTTYAAVALGANAIERHITLDRAMWGTDHAASVEPMGLIRMVRDIRVIEKALGDGIKKVYPSEIPVMKKLRRKDDTGLMDTLLKAYLSNNKG